MARQDFLAIRICNSAKPDANQGSEGVLAHPWIPEFRNMNQAFVHAPGQGGLQMNGCPVSVINGRIVRKAAAGRLYGPGKNNIEHKEAAKKIVAIRSGRKSRLQEQPAGKEQKTACKRI